MKLLSSLLVSVLAEEIVKVVDTREVVEIIDNVEVIEIIDVVEIIEIDTTKCHDVAGGGFRIFEERFIDTDAHPAIEMAEMGEPGLGKDGWPNCANDCNADKDCLFFTYAAASGTCQFGKVGQDQDETMFKRPSMWDETDVNVEDPDKTVFLKCLQDSPCAVKYFKDNRWTEFRGKPFGKNKFADDIVGEPINLDGMEVTAAECTRLCAEDDKCTAFYHRPDYEKPENDECILYRNKGWAVAKKGIDFDFEETDDEGNKIGGYTMAKCVGKCFDGWGDDSNGCYPQGVNLQCTRTGFRLTAQLANLYENHWLLTEDQRRSMVRVRGNTGNEIEDIEVKVGVDVEFEVAEAEAEVAEAAVAEAEAEAKAVAEAEVAELLTRGRREENKDGVEVVEVVEVEEIVKVKEVVEVDAEVLPPLEFQFSEDGTLEIEAKWTDIGPKPIYCPKEDNKEAQILFVADIKPDSPNIPIGDLEWEIFFARTTDFKVECFYSAVFEVDAEYSTFVHDIGISAGASGVASEMIGDFRLKSFHDEEHELEITEEDPISLGMTIYNRLTVEDLPAGLEYQVSGCELQNIANENWEEDKEVLTLFEEQACLHDAMKIVGLEIDGYNDEKTTFEFDFTSFSFQSNQEEKNSQNLACEIHICGGGIIECAELPTEDECPEGFSLADVKEVEVVEVIEIIEVVEVKEVVA